MKRSDKTLRSGNCSHFGHIKILLNLTTFPEQFQIAVIEHETHRKRWEEYIGWIVYELEPNQISYFFRNHGRVEYSAFSPKFPPLSPTSVSYIFPFRFIASCIIYDTSFRFCSHFHSTAEQSDNLLWQKKKHLNVK